MADTPHTLGIIAGNRTLPRVLAREARAAGVQQLVAAAFTDETEPELSELVDVIEWLRVGQLNKLVEVFQKNNVTQCVMVGQIAPKNLFDLRPDLRAVKLLASLPEKNAHSLFGGIADELAKDGIKPPHGLNPQCPRPVSSSDPKQPMMCVLTLSTVYASRAKPADLKLAKPWSSKTELSLLLKALRAPMPV